MECELIFSDRGDIPDKNFERKRYLLHKNSIDDSGYVKMFKDFLKISVGNKLGTFKNHLDYGCGPTPVLSEILKQNGLNSEFYDPIFFPDVILENNHYDFITATEVIEHVQNPQLFMKTMYNLLKPGGILAIMTHFHGKNIPKFIDWWYQMDPTHITFYTPKTLEVLCRKSGLIILFNDNKKIAVIGKEG
jgi:SAM-dependent methyltransferase